MLTYEGEGVASGALGCTVPAVFFSLPDKATEKNVIIKLMRGSNHNFFIPGTLFILPVSCVPSVLPVSGILLAASSSMLLTTQTQQECHLKRKFLRYFSIWHFNILPGYIFRQKFCVPVMT